LRADGTTTDTDAMLVAHASRDEKAEAAVTSGLAAATRAVPMRLPVAVVLGVTVGVAAVVQATLALTVGSPWIVPDELIYAELAKSLGDGNLPAIRDEVSIPYGIGYPLLLAPVWAVFDDVTTAYDVAKVVNALVLSLAAVPAYFLARRFVSIRSALLVAALSVAVPSMLYAGTIMTEVALYPAFVLALLAIAAAVERPSLATQAGALGAIGLAASVKMLAAILVLGYVASAALFAWLDVQPGVSWLGRMRAYAPTWVVLAVAAVAGSLVPLAAGRGSLDVLGAYSVVLGNIDVLAIPWWSLLHLAELDLYVAVIPFAATTLLVAGGLRTAAEPKLRLFAALVLPTTAGVLLVVGAYSSRAHAGAVGYLPSEARLHERSTFVLAPLFLIGLAMLFERRSFSRHGLFVTGVLAAVLPAAIPADQLGGNTSFQALALVPWSAADVRWPFACVLVTVALAALYVARAAPALLVGAVVLTFVVTAVSAHQRMDEVADWTQQQAFGGNANWIDDAAAGEPVSVLWAETAGGRFVPQAPRHRIVWLGEFFNRSVGRVFELGTPMPYALPSTRASLVRGRVILEDGRPAPLGKLVVVPCYVRLAGTAVRRDSTTGAVLIRVADPPRATVTAPDSCPRRSAP
jgi:hypothetical protein